LPPGRDCAQCCGNNKTSGELQCTQIWRTSRYWDSRNTGQKSQYHAITDKYTEAAGVVQQVHKVLREIQNLAGYTPDNVGESSEWASLLNSAEKNRTNYCKTLDASYGMYAIILKELKAVLKVNAQAGQSGAVSRTSVDSTAQDVDFHEAKRCKRHISNNTSQTAKKSAKLPQHPQLSSCLQKQC
jgi:hypothetical protein